jgi:hypothetical protein
MKSAILMLVLALFACGGVSTIAPSDPSSSQDDKEEEREEDREEPENKE